MYTWGYIKENTLGKLGLTEKEANQQGFLSLFPYYANEAMTQICSAVKPREKKFHIHVFDRAEAWPVYTRKYGVYTEYLSPIEDNFTADDPDFEKKKAFWNAWNSLYFVDEPITLPSDFISFSGDDIRYRKQLSFSSYATVYDSDDVIDYDEEHLEIYGYNQVICKAVGYYVISYNARWFLFTKDLQNDVSIPAPIDVCECLPSYIASQCLKIDDELKAAIYRNEYEMFLARIDNSSAKGGGIKIGGGW